MSSHFLLNCLTRFRTQSHKLDPDPCTREAIAYFATSLNFDVRARQAKSEIYDGSLRKMCRSIHEHPMRAEIGRPDRNLASPALIAHMQFAEMLNSRFATSRYSRRFLACAFPQVRTPSVAWSADAAEESASPGPRRVPQNGQNRYAGGSSCPHRSHPVVASASMGTTRIISSNVVTPA
jgi:hypothetical protein